jgi:hypothetical protein
MLTRSKARKEISSLGQFCLRHGQLLNQALLNVFGNELRWKEEDFLSAFTQRILGVVRPRKTDFMYLMLRRKDPEQNFRKLETPYRGGVNITINQDPLRARLKAFERLSKLPQVIEQSVRWLAYEVKKQAEVLLALATIARDAVGYTQSRKIRCDILNEVHFYSEWTKRIQPAMKMRARVLRATCATNRKFITNREPDDKGMW